MAIDFVFRAGSGGVDDGGIRIVGNDWCGWRYQYNRKSIFNFIYILHFRSRRILAIIPAGLGINEISTIGLLEKLIKINYPQALVITFVFRLVTLWFGIFLGLGSILYLERRLKDGNVLE